MILVKIALADDIERVSGIIITSLNIKASNARRDINKWFLFRISATMADIEQICSMVMYEFISISIVLDQIAFS
jgi:hypothetical protein